MLWLALPVGGQGIPPPESGREAPAAGATAFLWGRLRVEEESPDGAWAALPGVEVVAYPDAPAVAAQLHQIRETARASGRQYETAVARIQEVLRAYARGLDPYSPPAHAEGRGGPAVGPGSASRASDDRGSVRRRVTDSAGVFVFDTLPPGDWMVVAVRVAPYSVPRAPGGAPRAGRGRERFAGSPPGTAAREAEIWLERVRLGPGTRTRLLWSDRARWFVGPVR